MSYERKYGRNDVDFNTFYSPWMKRLALDHSIDELRKMRDGKKRDAEKSAVSHLRAIKKSHSMAGNSSARARTRSAVEAAGEARIALDGAIEIHELFPERAKSNVAKKTCPTCQADQFHEDCPRQELAWGCPINPASSN